MANILKNHSLGKTTAVTKLQSKQQAAVSQKLLYEYVIICILYFVLQVKDLPYKIKKKDIKQFFKPISCYSIRIPREIHGIAFVGFKNAKQFNQALMKDRSFISKSNTLQKYV